MLQVAEMNKSAVIWMTFQDNIIDDFKGEFIVHQVIKSILAHVLRPYVSYMHANVNLIKDSN